MKKVKEEEEADQDDLPQEEENLPPRIKSSTQSSKPRLSQRPSRQSQRDPERNKLETPTSHLSQGKSLKENNFSDKGSSSRLGSRDKATGSRFDLQRESNAQLIGEGRIGEYGEEEENINCARFPHLSFCACQPNCQEAIKEVEFNEVKSVFI